MFQEGSKANTLASIDRLLLESVDSALGVMGESVKNSIFSYLANNCSVSKEEVPRKVERFMQGLREVLGYGSVVVEKLAVKAFAERVHIRMDDSNQKSLADIVRLVKGRAADPQ